MQLRLCKFMVRGAGRGLRCGAFRGAIRLRAAAWIWCRMRAILCTEQRIAQASTCGVSAPQEIRSHRRKPALRSGTLLTIWGKRVVLERAQGNVGGNPRAAGTGAVHCRVRRMVAHL